MERKRNSGIDWLKILAAFFVVVLHVTGYTAQFHGVANYSSNILNAYLLIESIAIPAVNIFVIAGCYYMVERAPALGRIWDIQRQTWIVTMAGLIWLLIFEKESVGVTGGVQCLFPVISKAYWFVTTYIFLMLLSPYLNIFIRNCSDRQLYIATGITVGVLSGIATFASIVFYEWQNEYSDIGLFVMLYLIAASIRRLEGEKKILKTNWVMLWAISTALLYCSALVFIARGSNKYLHFYQYQSPLVLFQAIGAFLIFKELNFNGIWMNAGRRLVKYSLITYLLHMHPMIKGRYTDWAVFSFVSTSSSWKHILEIIAIALVIFFCEMGIGIFILKASDVIKKVCCKIVVKFRN